MGKNRTFSLLQVVAIVITSIASLIFNTASIDDVKHLFSSIEWGQPDIWIRLIVNILFIASWLWFGLSREKQLKEYLNARPYIVVKDIGRQDFNGFHRYGIVIENHPKWKASNGNTDTNVSVDFKFSSKTGKELYKFDCTRWDETFTLKQMREKGKSALENKSVILEADISRRIAFFLGRFDKDPYLYIHNNDSYTGDNIVINPKQIISKKKFEIEAIVKANRADNLIVWMEVKSIKNKHPKITITKIKRETDAL